MNNTTVIVYSSC